MYIFHMYFCEQLFKALHVGMFLLFRQNYARSCTRKITTVYLIQINIAVVFSFRRFLNFHLNYIITYNERFVNTCTLEPIHRIVVLQ